MCSGTACHVILQPAKGHAWSLMLSVRRCGCRCRVGVLRRALEGTELLQSLTLEQAIKLATAATPEPAFGAAAVPGQPLVVVAVDEIQLLESPDFAWTTGLAKNLAVELNAWGRSAGGVRLDPLQLIDRIFCM
jgi:hypothetical protein